MIVIDTAQWTVYQWGLLVFLVLDLCASAWAHGKPRNPFSFGRSAFNWLATLIFLTGAGFFK